MLLQKNSAVYFFLFVGTAALFFLSALAMVIFIRYKKRAWRIRLQQQTGCLLADLSVKLNTVAATACLPHAEQQLLNECVRLADSLHLAIGSGR